MLPAVNSRTRFKEGIEAGDFEAAIDQLADDVVFRSPVVFKPYEGKEAVAALLRFVAEVFEDFRYVTQLDADDRMALIFEARVGERELQGLDLIRFDADDRIVEFTVMVRPMSGMHALAEAMQAKLEAAGAA
jgi:SnoaL-like domain